jgi:N-acetylneuraminic acid mutarotase
MRTTFSIGLAVALALVIVNLAAADTWTRKTDMPTARYCFAASEVDGKIYAVGGWDAWTDTTPLATVEVYDPETDTWERKADMPTARGALATAVLDGKIYAIGGGRGQSSFSTVEVYDPVSDTWEQGVSMSTKRWFHSATVVNGRIYAIGGAFSRTIEEYDPDTRTWTTKAGMPTDRWVFGTGVVNGRIYVIGGDTSAGLTSSVLEYDPIADNWTPKTDVPTTRAAHGAAVVRSRIYCVGGGSNPNSPGLSTLEVYNPAVDAWEAKADMPTPRGDLAVTVADGKIYAIGGFSNRICSTVEEYTPGSLFPDFNGDYLIDMEDLLILIEHWGGNDPALDIAPAPSGDGVIDAQDLEALMHYWGRELDDPRLLARWGFDETEGSVAHDSAGENDATVIGLPGWQPNGGIVEGALHFDGATLVVADSVLSPSDGPFSVFAWIKDGAPGQVILSQAEGVNWLGIDPALGTVVTELRGQGRFSKPLYSEAMVTDGAWHRLGFTWDGSHRRLYVDDIVVAEDLDRQFTPCRGDLNIACGTDMASVSFWTGLIDDVRIYNRAIEP